MCGERRASVGAQSKKARIERKKAREREREKGKERISVISVDNVVYAASKHNDATFAK